MRSTWVLVAAALVATSCDKYFESSTRQITQPGVLPSDAPPGSTPAPTTLPPPTTAPPPTTQPAGLSCTLPPGTGNGHGCQRQSPRFLTQVEQAMDDLVAAEPSLFDTRDTQGCGKCYKVRNPSRYVNRMVEMVEAQGLCAHYDGEELAVKNHNSFNDQYDILTSQMFIRRDTGSYRSTCYPAWF